ncbi:ribosomal protein S19 family protein [bacterium]|nr:MAG: ribosomal protein S19 family protein [bacterium]
MLVKYKTKKRSQIITAELVGKNIKVYNGKLYIPVLITAEMIGHKLGEFSLTKKIGSSIHLSEKNKKKKEKVGVSKK